MEKQIGKSKRKRQKKKRKRQPMDKRRQDYNEEGGEEEEVAIVNEGEAHDHVVRLWTRERSLDR